MTTQINFNKEEYKQRIEALKATVTTQAKVNVMKAMDVLIDAKGLSENGKLRMISKLDIQRLFASKGVKLTLDYLSAVISVLIDEKMVRFYPIPNTNYIAYCTTELYRQLRTRASAPKEEEEVVQQPVEQAKPKRKSTSKKVTV